MNSKNPLAGYPHIWAPKYEAKTPWLDHWATSNNDHLPEKGLDFYDRDLPDDGFSLGDPLDDINYWELPFTAGQRVSEEPRSEFKVHAVECDWPGADLSDDETIELNDVEPIHFGEDDQKFSGMLDVDEDHGIEGHDNGNEEYYGADYEIVADRTEILPSLPSPEPRAKTVQFEMCWSNNSSLLDPRPFRVKIWPNDKMEDIEHGIKMFFNLYNTESIKVLMFIDEHGVWFNPFWDTLNHNMLVSVRVWDEALRGEMMAKVKKIRDRRRKVNGGLKRRGRKIVWRKSGGEERKRVKGRFVSEWGEIQQQVLKDIIETPADFRIAHSCGHEICHECQ